MNALGNIMAAAERVMGPVGFFAEEIVRTITGGENVSKDQIYADKGDVLVRHWETLIQVKACGTRHPVRTSEGQVSRLLDEVESPNFLDNINTGLYGMVFYRGMKWIKGGKGRYKSVLTSRKLALADKFELLANELRAVYFIDVKVLAHILKTPTDFSEVIKRGDECLLVQPEGKKSETRGSRFCLSMNRTFLSEFIGGDTNISPTHRRALDDSLGVRKWITKVTKMKIKVVGKEKFTTSVPVKFVGNKRMWPKLEEMTRGS